MSCSSVRRPDARHMIELAQVFYLFHGFMEVGTMSACYMISSLTIK